MKKIIQGAVAFGALSILLTGCGSEFVADKRALGEPGEKTYQVLVIRDTPLGERDAWITVTEDQWDRCDMLRSYKDCEYGN